MINYRLNRGRLVHMEYLQKDADLVSLIVPSTVGAPSRAVYLASILAMVSIFGLDLADGSTIWLHVLYVFPIAACAYYCERVFPVALAVAIAGGFQLITLLAYDMPVSSIAVNILIETASGAMIVALTRGARANIARMEALSVMDELTRLPNRRGMETVIRREIAR